ncbi:uncharacterized protein MAM_06195 [Metarhizium album ARSEF 1941]|uniref:DUF2470 domain-containing protein n=1 Tax=Metarhizium album (strain ARSEF 1941) TaxID=1081103 RepID=A0A0B2WP95_METAS|nr:uncharacterized protein MAM_06195 [Metarhizium album ARSEF 1941]KHN95833.1 hypothetical protein MAM_06195 [Metarhizium album ARSEF 1941]
MAALTPADQGLQERILSHMNTSHTRELTHYLRHYCGLTPSQARGASLRDVTLQGMRIRAGGADYVVHFKPALQSWSDVRPRIIEMDAIARESLGISGIYMARYHAPGFGDAIVLATVVFYFASFLALPWIVPGSLVWDILAAYFPGGPETFAWAVKLIFYPVLAIHLLEPIVLDVTRLQKHGVDRWSGLWWMWMVSCFFEGLLVFRRFDRAIAEKRAEKEAKKQ